MKEFTVHRLWEIASKDPKAKDLIRLKGGILFKNDKKSNLSKKAGFTERDKGILLLLKKKNKKKREESLVNQY